MIKKLIFLIIPLVLMTFAFNRSSIVFWKGGADPSYAYLLNGSNLAYEHGNVGMYQHPGSSVMLINAFIIQVTYKIKDTDNNLREDVLLHPESYIKVISWFFTMINCTLVFLLGILIFKFTKNISYGLLFQSISFLSSLGLTIFYNVGPEPVLFGSVLLFVVVFLTKFYFNKSGGVLQINYQTERRLVSILNIDGLIICLALLMGFCFATKMNCMPLILVPLLFVYKKNIVSFLGFTFLSTLIFTLPIANHYDDLFVWVKGIFTHSGNYGSGDEQFINFVELPKKMGVFLLHEPIVIFILLSSFCIIIRQFYLKIFDIHFKVLGSVLLMQIGGLIMIFKHFEIRYYLPVYITLIINLFMMFEILNFKNKVKDGIIYSFIISSFLFSFFQIKYEEDTFTKLYTPSEISVNENYINVYSEGCHSKEYALKFGDFFASNANAKTLEKLYGTNYFFIIWEQQLYDWRGSVEFDSLFKLNKKIYFYCSDRFVKTYNFKFKLKRVSNGRYLVEQK